MNDHKREVYGDRIIVQREIKEKSTALKLFSQFGKEQFSGKEANEELQNILSKTFIDVDNRSS